MTLCKKTVVFLILAAALQVSLTCVASEPPRVDAKETEWSAWIAREIGGQTEVAFEDGRGRGRVDILTDHAIEIEWAKAPKGPESLDQAERGGVNCHAKPAVIFLVGRKSIGFEKGVVATVTQFGKARGIVVGWIDVRHPGIERVRKLLGMPTPVGDGE